MTTKNYIDYVFNPGMVPSTGASIRGDMRTLAFARVRRRELLRDGWKDVIITDSPYPDFPFRVLVLDDPAPMVPRGCALHGPVPTKRYK